MTGGYGGGWRAPTLISLARWSQSRERPSRQPASLASERSDASQVLGENGRHFLPIAISASLLPQSGRRWRARLMRWLRSIKRDRRMRGGLPRICRDESPAASSRRGGTQFVTSALVGLISVGGARLRDRPRFVLRR